MGRQIRFYLLPSDVDRLLDDLKESAGIRLFLEKMPTAELVEVNSKTSERSSLGYSGLLHYEQCCLVPTGDLRIKTWFVEQQGYWLIDSESEMIAFGSCDYGGDELLQGRFYYQTDLLTPTRDAIVPKSPEFIGWAEKVFRRSKKLLHWSSEFDAYLGEDARKWQEEGGRFLDNAAAIRLRASHIRLLTTKIQ